MKQMLEDIHIHYDEPIPIFCDNTNAISISKNPVMHSKTKHIPIKFHFLREQVMSKVIKVEYVLLAGIAACTVCTRLVFVINVKL
jgi:hypothetical protein